MDEMEFTEAESNMNDLVSEYQQYQVPMFPFSYVTLYISKYDGDSHKKEIHFHKTVVLYSKDRLIRLENFVLIFILFRHRA